MALIMAFCLSVSMGVFGVYWSTIYGLLSALITLLFIVGSVTMVGGISMATTKAVKKYQATKKANRDITYTRFTVLTHLTPADEDWLATRHFWVMPPEVARMRAGQPWEKPWWYGGGVPIEVRRQWEIKAKAEHAKGVFHGENRSDPAPTKEPPISGEVIGRRGNGNYPTPIYDAYADEDRY